MITVVGLGNSPEDMTAAGASAVAAAPCVTVRTCVTAAGKAVKGAKSMDDLFDSSADFNALSLAIADRLLLLEKERGAVVYCTDGDGLHDAAVEELSRRGAQINIVKGVAGGPSRPCGALLGMTAAQAVARRPYLDTTAAVSVNEIDDKFLAGELKLYLLEFYPPDAPAVLESGKKQRAITLEELDRGAAYGVDTALFVPACLSFGKRRSTFSDLLRLTARLTAPDGCPWDRAQTHESIRSNMIEEAYEAVDAVDSGDLEAICEELGDVMLQVALHCDIAARTGEFTTGDVISALCAKLHDRHTHIFGSDRAASSKEAHAYWDKAKAEEKRYEGLYDVLSRLPKGFPSLLRAEKACKKAVKAGEERAAQPIGENELKDTLFELCRRAAASGLDAETALNERTQEYIEGFKKS